MQKKIRKVQYHYLNDYRDEQKKRHFLVKVSEMETLGLGFLPSHPGEPQESRALC